MGSQISSEFFIEMFPVKMACLRPLSAYVAIGRAEALAAKASSLAYRLQSRLSSHWAWSDHHFITDSPAMIEEVQQALLQLWHDAPDDFNEIQAINPDPSWIISPQATADFVARGLLRDLRHDMNQAVQRYNEDFGPVVVKRYYASRGWVIDGIPSVQLSVYSKLQGRESLTALASRMSSSLIGMWVRDRFSSLTGRIIAVSGTLADHRHRLMALARPETQERLAMIPDSELVVTVRTAQKGYDYCVSLLSSSLRLADLPHYKIPTSPVSKALHLSPADRAQMVRAVHQIAEDHQILHRAYRSTSSPQYFLTAEDIGFVPHLHFGRQHVHLYPMTGLLRLVQQYGVYRHAAGVSSTHLRLGVLNGTPIAVDSWLSKLKDELHKCQLSAEFLPTLRLSTFSRDYIERAIQRYEQEAPDLFVCFLPHETADKQALSDYNVLKSTLVLQGIASQGILRKTVSNDYALNNIVLGILAKTGHVPFVLGEPLPYTDMIVGLDIARRTKQQLSGSMNIAAMVCIYRSNGDFLRYNICDAPLEGETIPEHILQSFFPLKEFQGKRVIIHRDGRFRGQEKVILTQWAQKIGATFCLVEIVKDGIARMYMRDNRKTHQCPLGMAFKLTPHAGCLVASQVSPAMGMPQSLGIFTEPPFPIEQALHSVLSFTLLHHGSVRPPRLPITLHFSDIMADLAIRNIKPKMPEGDRPYWL